MFERPQRGERAVLVHLNLGGGPSTPEEIEEFHLLARSAGAQIVGFIGGSRRAPDPHFFLGSGKADEVRAQVAAQDAEIVLFDHALTPAQERNLERHLGCRVLDRSGLILDIFAQRARSFEGKIQVELAQLKHLSTRLVRGWTHLERQKGGIGLRGPGETQLESDRRLLNARIALLNQRLNGIAAQRHLGRSARVRAELPVLSLVGYTNGGKSTLFNRLTQANTEQADQLFVTLDPLLRRLSLPNGQAVVLADTVGFISRLPHELVAAFRSTLEETRQADLLLHVIDGAAPRRQARIREVEDLLTEIGAEAPQIQVMNKLDRVANRGPRVERGPDGRVRRVWLSAKTGAGIDLLLAAIAEHFQDRQVDRRIRLEAGEGDLRAWCFRHGQVLEERGTETGGWELRVRLGRTTLNRLLQRRPHLKDRCSET